MKTVRAFILAAVATSFAVLAGACTTQGYCFKDCEKNVDGGVEAGGEGGTGGIFGDSGGNSGFGAFEGGTTDACVASEEICDGVDNDCDGKIDEAEDIDFTRVDHCGDCATNCVTALKFVTTPICTPPAVADLGTTPGTCSYDTCAPGFYDVDGKPENGCEYYCQWNPTGANTTDPGGLDGCGRDDDCDGTVDEDVNVCGQLDNCGECGHACVTPHATAFCDSSAAGTAACELNVNTFCVIATNPDGTKACDAGWVDVDGAPENGCEYECTPTNGGVEICDGIDNDCDRNIDNADPDLETADPDVGDPCFGGTTGECIDPTHQGLKKCIAGAIQCCDQDSNNIAQTDANFPSTGLRNGICDSTVAPLVLKPGENKDTCDGVDQDCDGVVDGILPTSTTPVTCTTDADCAAQSPYLKCLPLSSDPTVLQCAAPPTDAGAFCGSAVGNCQVGTMQCVSAQLTCVGAVGGTVETCDGEDDDCDGVIDGTKPTTGTPVSCTSAAQCATQAPYTACLPISSDPNNKACVQPPSDVADANGTALACNVPPPAPAGGTEPCQAGTEACVGGVAVCQGSIVAAAGAVDQCFEDTNCNGILENQTGLTTNDVANCGSCGNDCNTLGANGTWSCNAGVCVRTGCDPGFIECGGTSPNDCETACTATNSMEDCDGVDNDCDCQVDEAPLATPSVFIECGVSAAATDPNCTNPTMTCNGAQGWSCTFAAGYCTTGTCSTTVDTCDGLDNNCNGVADESFKPPLLNQGFLGQACFSDDGQPAPGDGPCRTTGVFVCKADGTGTMCNAVKDLSLAQTEICDGIDNDCDGLVDGQDPSMADSRIGVTCQGGTLGICADTTHSGTTTCGVDAAGTIGPICTGANVVVPGQVAETCNLKDDDCDGTVDNNLTDAGAICGSGVGQCTTGILQCTTGVLVCTGNTGPQPEVCDGLDNDCDGMIDGTMPANLVTCVSDADCVSQAPNTACLPVPSNPTTRACMQPPTDVGAACNVPPPPPPGATSPCVAGTIACIGATPVCQGSVTSGSTTDECGEDTNCDGVLTNQTGLNNSDPANCGSCGNNCSALDPNGIWSCQSGTCVLSGCQTGHINCDGNALDCERVCNPTSSTELCNGVDDDCDCQIDEGLTAPSPVQVCGVSATVNDPNCLAPNVQVTCGGATGWQCTFPAGYCLGGNCSTTAELCDGKDNDCDGSIDETFKYPTKTTGFLGQACSAGTAACQQTGSYVCNLAGTDTTCNAVAAAGNATLELCNNIDDDCDGVVDDSADVIANDPVTGSTCFGGTLGVCADAGHAGTYNCVSGTNLCQGAIVKPGDIAEICDGLDNDCDGVVDGTLPPLPATPTPCTTDANCTVAPYTKCLSNGTSLVCAAESGDVGDACGNGQGSCSQGVTQCVGGSPQCVGAVTGTSETCNGLDDDCDGIIDNNLTGMGTACNVPPAAPLATAQCNGSDAQHPLPTSACQQGILACTSGVLDCQGDVIAQQGVTDSCCEDTNCDGLLDNQPNFLTDVHNCGGCGNDCATMNATAHATGWTCNAGACQLTGCASGFYDCNGDQIDCEYACNPTSGEICNGADDDCNCQIDDGLATPTPDAVCGTSPLASDPNCLAPAVQVTCGGASGWQCAFPAGYCTAATCSQTTDICDGQDNNCNGNTDENSKVPVLNDGTALNTPCTTASSDGICQGTGVYVCAMHCVGGTNNGNPCLTVADCPGSGTTCVLNGTNATMCNAVKNTGLVAAEACDGLDNDCDGSIDEIDSAPGADPTRFVKPAVIQLAPSLWIFEYEASRPNATTTSAGTGNGFWTGSSADMTHACSVPGKIPWFNVTPMEVEQTCQAMGGDICPTTTWTTACQAGSSCTWGYATNCTSPANYGGTPYCNLDPFDFNTGTTGDQDGLLPTASNLLSGCFANTGAGIFDITGNLREITKRAAGDYPLMGGAFNTASEAGAACDFDFYSVPATFKFFDTGFRCCFTEDPTTTP